MSLILLGPKSPPPEVATARTEVGKDRRRWTMALGAARRLERRAARATRALRLLPALAVVVVVVDIVVTLLAPPITSPFPRTGSPHRRRPGHGLKTRGPRRRRRRPCRDASRARVVTFTAATAGPMAPIILSGLTVLQALMSIHERHKTWRRVR